MRHLLVALVTAALLPTLAATGAVTWNAVATYRRAFEDRLSSTARALALAVEGEISRIRPALLPLASSPLIGVEAGPAELAQFYARASRQAAAFDTWFWLSGAASDLLPIALATSVPFGSPLPAPNPERPGAYSTMLEVARTGQPAVSPVYQSALLGRPMAAAAMPVMQEGRVVRVLVAALDPARLVTILAAQYPVPGGFAVLVDGRGTVAAHSSRPEKFVGQPLPGWHARLAAGPGGTVANVVLGGHSVVVASQPLGDAAPGWTLLVAEPRAAYDASWQHPLLLYSLATLAALAVAVLAAKSVAARLLRPVDALTARAKEVIRVSELQTPAVLPARLAAVSGIAEVNALQGAFEQAAAALRHETEATRRERDLLQSVVDGSGDVIFVKDTKGRYLLVNQAGCAVLGQPAAALLGRTDRAWLPPELADAIMAIDREVMAEGRAHRTEEVVLQGGVPRIFQASKSPWREPSSGRVLGLIGVSRDQTVQRQEEERRRIVDVELQTMARRATAGAMVGGIAHEVSQPLSTLSNYLGASRRLLDRAGVPPDAVLVAQARDMVAEAAAEAIRAGDILRRLREFIRGGKTPSRPEPVQPLLDQAAALVLAGRPADALRVRVSAADAAGTVLADRVGVLQVLVNLMRNALEATEATRGLVSLLAKPTLTPPSAHMVEFTVTDDGPGLPPEIRPRLFEAFVSTKPDGMGVGLTISRTIVEGHGGRIWAEPGSGDKGTTFRFTLPAASNSEGA
jgi:two-component system sensor kinase FixL